LTRHIAKTVPQLLQDQINFVGRESVLFIEVPGPQLTVDSTQRRDMKFILSITTQKNGEDKKSCNASQESNAYGNHQMDISAMTFKRAISSSESNKQIKLPYRQPEEEWQRSD